MAETEQNSGSSIAWFFVGALVGAAAAILYAPNSGKQTREILTKRAGDTTDSLTETSKELMDKGKELYERGRQLADEAADLFDKGRKLVRG